MINRDSLAQLNSPPPSFAEVDEVIHCAGPGTVGFAEQNLTASIAGSLETLALSLKFCRERPEKRRLVFLSSVAVYGAGALPFAETATPSPVSFYGEVKLLTEQLCRWWAKQYSVPAVVVRLASVYGPGLRKQLPWDASLKFLSPERHLKFVGTGEEERDFIHIEDTIRAIELASKLASTECPVFNAGTGTPTTIRQVLEIINGGLGAHKPYSFDKQVIAPVKLFPNTQKIQRAGFSAKVALENGLREYARWVQETSRVKKAG